MTAPELHAHFCALTEQKLTLSYERQMTWSQYVARGLTGEDLALVVRWTKAHVTRGEGGFSQLSLQMRAMVTDLDRFEERLNLARAKYARRRAPEVKPAPIGNAKQDVCQNTEERAAILRGFEDFGRKVGRRGLLPTSDHERAEAGGSVKGPSGHLLRDAEADPS